MAMIINVIIVVFFLMKERYTAKIGNEEMIRFGVDFSFFSLNYMGVNSKCSLNISQTLSSLIFLSVSIVK